VSRGRLPPPGVPEGPSVFNYGHCGPSPTYKKTSFEPRTPGAPSPPPPPPPTALSGPMRKGESWFENTTVFPLARPMVPAGPPPPPIRAQTRRTFFSTTYTAPPVSCQVGKAPPPRPAQTRPPAVFGIGVAGSGVVGFGGGEGSAFPPPALRYRPSTRPFSQKYWKEPSPEKVGDNFFCGPNTAAGHFSCS